MIIVFEPFCEGFEHSNFNAAFLKTLCLAYSDDQISFYGDNNHIDLISKWILNSGVKNISFHSVKLPDKKITTDIRRTPRDILNCFKILKITKQKKANILIVSTISTQLLFFLKLILFVKSGLKCYVVPHDIIQTITKKPMSIKADLFWFRRALQFITPKNLKILTIGSITKNWLSKEIPSLKDHLSSVEMAYLFDNKKIEKIQRNENTIRFGFLGVGTIRKGADLFFQLAQELNCMELKKKVEFILIGKIVDDEIIKENNCVYVPSPKQPLSRDEFSKYAKSIDYAMILYDKKYYDILHGASIMDCLEFSKPVVALRTSFLEYFFSQMGNIGVLCNNYDEVKESIIKIVQDETDFLYEERCRNVAIGRQMCTPEVLAKSYREVIE